MYKHISTLFSAYTLLYNIDTLRIESDAVAPSSRARYYLLPGTAINKTDPKYNDIYIGQYTSINPYYVWNWTTYFTFLGILP